MANLKTKRLWDDAWSKLSVFFSPSKAVESPFGRALLIEEPITLYVEATGSDAGDGSATSPYRSIQAAIDSLDHAVIRNKVTIQVGTGSFGAFSLSGSRTLVSAPSTTGQTGLGSLNITGTWATPTLGTGTASGTATGGVVDLAAVLTDAGQSWTVNALRGLYVTASSAAGIYYPIISNTATTITCTSTTALSGTYSIWQPGTRIDTGTVVTSGGSGTSRIAFAGMADNISTVVVISTLYILADGMGSGEAGVSVRSGGCSLTNCTIERTTGSGTNCISINNSINTNITRCSLLHNSVSGNGITASGTAMFIFSCYLRNVATAYTASSNSHIQASATTFDTCTTGISVTRSRVFLSPANRFLSCTTALSAAVGGTSDISASTSNTIYFNGCTTVLSAAGSGTSVLGVASGSGNTNGIVATLGACVQIANTGVLAVSGNELSVDGTAGTLATLRAASPRVFPLTPNPYGTYIYE